MRGELLRTHAQAAVRSFIVPSGRSRLLALLDKATAKNWAKFQLELLGLTTRLDERWARPLTVEERSPERVESLLLAAHAPRTCVVISEDEHYDDEHPLREVLQDTVGRASVLVSCVPGVLAYYQSEDASDMCLLHRPRS